MIHTVYVVITKGDATLSPNGLMRCRSGMHHPRAYRREMRRWDRAVASACSPGIVRVEQ